MPRASIPARCRRRPLPDKRRNNRQKAAPGAPLFYWASGPALPGNALALMVSDPGPAAVRAAVEAGRKTTMDASTKKSSSTLDTQRPSAHE
jgi:hypothetical protein